MDDKNEISEIDAHLLAQKMGERERLLAEIKRKKTLCSNYLTAIIVICATYYILLTKNHNERHMVLTMLVILGIASILQRSVNKSMDAFLESIGEENLKNKNK